MKKTTLLMKGRWRTALLVLLLGAVEMGKGYASHWYDFSALCPSGQRLYYEIIDATNHYVRLVAPSDDSWYGFNKPTGNIVLPESVSYQGTPYTVISIGSFAFFDCDGLTGSLNIPNSVTTIGNNAFSSCSGFTGSLTISNSVTTIGTNAFSTCSGFTGDLVIPNSVTTIGKGAFCYCTGLTHVTIPNSVTSIGIRAFESCYNLEEVNFNAINCTSMGPEEYGEYGVFQGCNNLRTLTFGNEVQTIPNYAFSNCHGFQGELIIPNSVTHIGNWAFYQCDGFQSELVIPNSVTYIGKSAFRQCTGFSSVSIQNAVTPIEDCAFYGCYGFTSLSLGDSITTINWRAFEECDGITTVVIPKSVTSISENAFDNCSRLTTIFYNAENATGYSAFSNCTNLTTIHIGADVQEIHPIFSGCSSVHLVVALGPTPAVLESNALTDIADNSILMVSCGKRMTYFSVWNMFEFNNIIEDCGEYSVNMSGVGAGGNVTASATNAQMGQEVRLTVSPNAGMMLSSISVCNATDPTQNIPVYPIGKANSTYGFIMPPFGVSISASFMAGTSVNENNDIPVSVYPNPTKGKVTIEAENLKHITISNMLGQIIYKGNTSGNEFTYDFGKYKAGIYLIRIETASGLAVKKVSVER